MVPKLHQTQEELLRPKAALENVVEGISQLNEQGYYVSVNEAYAHMLGYEPVEMIGMMWQSVIHPDDLEKIATAYQQMLTCGRAETEAKVICRDGSCVYKQVVMVKVADGHQNTLLHYCFMKDITQHRQTEAALQEAQANLEQQVEAQIVELQRANDLLSTKIAEHEATEVLLQQQNTEIEQQLRDRTNQLQQVLESEAILNRLIDRVRGELDEEKILQIIAAELGAGLNLGGCDVALYNEEQTTVTIRCAYATSMPAMQEQTLQLADFPELQEQRLQGESLQLCMQHPLRGRVVIFICPIFVDPNSENNRRMIGDLWLFKHQDQVFNELEVRLVQQVSHHCAIAIRQVRLFQAAQIQLAELANLNRLKDEFLSTVSHELRTPMSNMKMAIQMLAIAISRNQAALPEGTKPQVEQDKVNRYLQILQNQCEREIELINDLLDLQQLDAEAQRLILAAIPLENWLPQVAEPFQKQTQERQQILQLDIPSHLPVLISDYASLGRVLTELLNNAHKYTPSGEQITLSAHAQAGKVQISVCNTGVEIPDNELSKIFDKFYRIPTIDPWKEGGTGLGLSLVQKLVSRLEGTLRVESAAGQTCFIVELPVKNADKPA